MTDPSALSAVTRRREGPVDLLGEAGPDGRLWRDESGGLAATGVAATLSLPGGLADHDSVTAIGRALAAIPATDEVGLPGCGPVALGALPYDPDQPATLVIPQRIIGCRDGVAWETVISGGRAAEESTGQEAVSEGGPDQFELISSRPHAEWRQVVAEAVEHVRTGALQKVVLARCVDVVANRPFLIPEVLARLVALYPQCMVFSMDGFLGASPELLIRRVGDHVSSHPLAGTVARSGDAQVDAALVAGLLSSTKERWEHRLVVDGLADALAVVCSALDVPDEPSVMALRNVSHLGTEITGQLRAGALGRPESALELVARIHPTPAVGGSPTADALRYQLKVEGFDRARYAGPVGWVDARGDGAWALGIRSADVSGRHARMYAGVGIVSDSDPDAELAETQLKLQALLAALVRP